MDDLLKTPGELEECWHDEQRMDFLFSAFPDDINLNPEHWESKLNFWRRLIISLCLHSTRVCINFEILSGWLKWKGRTPLGLPLVWDTMIKEGTLHSASEYLGDITRNGSWLGWGVNTFVRKPTLWVTGKMLSPLKTFTSPRSIESNKSFICVKSFEDKCAKLIDLLHTTPLHAHGFQRVVSLLDLFKLTHTIASDRNELEMLLLTLERNKKVVLFQNEDLSDARKFIKVGRSPDVAVTPVNECDHGMVKLEETRKRLEAQISALSTEQNTLQRAAKDYVRKGERVMAMNTLRRKRRCALNSELKESSLDNIQQLLARLEQCQTDQMVMAAYKAGVSAYKHTTKVNNLTIDDVDATMDDVRSMCEEHDDVISAMASPIDESVSNEDLEKELAALLVDEEESVVSNQTDADIAKLVTGIGALTTTVSPPRCDGDLSSITKPQISSRKKVKIPVS